MEFHTYDKAKWHWGAEDAPEDLPQENGGTHIAFILRWCIEKGFYSEEFLEDFSECIDGIKSGGLDCREFFISGMDGSFSSEDLNEEGQVFLNEYYTNENTEFAKKFSWYLADYEKILNNLSREKNSKDDSYFYIDNSNENYVIVKKIIDKRYEEFYQVEK